MFTQEEIIKMAELADAYADAMDVGGKNYSGLRDEFFAKLVAEKAAKSEREACAKVCAEDESGRDSGGYYAEIIRERGQQ